MSLLHVANDGAELTLVVVFGNDMSGSETVGGGFESERLDALETLQPS